MFPSCAWSLQVRFAAQTLSNLLGGVGYWYGESRVTSPELLESGRAEAVQYWTAPLYSAVPARSQFPRGFLWDEGFHGLLLQEWDAEMALDSLKHWLSLMNVDGWIPREQILGISYKPIRPLVTLFLESSWLQYIADDYCSDYWKYSCFRTRVSEFQFASRTMYLRVKLWSQTIDTINKSRFKYIWYHALF